MGYPGSKLSHRGQARRGDQLGLGAGESLVCRGELGQLSTSGGLLAPERLSHSLQRSLYSCEQWPPLGLPGHLQLQPAELLDRRLGTAQRTTEHQVEHQIANHRQQKQIESEIHW